MLVPLVYSIVLITNFEKDSNNLRNFSPLAYEKIGLIVIANDLPLTLLSMLSLDSIKLKKRLLVHQCEVDR